MEKVNAVCACVWGGIAGSSWALKAPQSLNRGVSWQPPGGCESEGGEGGRVPGASVEESRERQRNGEVGLAR